jgi:acyl-[acyl-carrier-protein]-phospholipid O-acyltransferase/long-chain-fatty-acid--[acyl-carrier-protein] ligase
MKLPLSKRFNSFTYLNITQFLGALNDNVFKLLIVYFLIDMNGIENSASILATAGAIFVVPFLIFSAYAGKLADRLSKRNILVFSKLLEVVVMALGLLAFILQSQTGAYSILFLMATQSAIFSPSKYGIVPELVKSDRLSYANGLLTTFTFLAIIIGTFLASFITDISGRNFILASVFCVFTAAIGAYTCFHIEYTPPIGHKKRFNLFFIYEVYKTLMRARRENRLFCAILGSAFFLFASAFIQLNIIPFAIQSLDLTDVQGGYLFLITALGIGAGSLLAGNLSGKHVELGLIPFGGFGMSLTCILLHFFANNLYAVVILIVILGMFGGIWIVPFDSYIQASSPTDQRGQMVATTNFLGFLGVLFASGALYLFSNILGLQASFGFFLIGWISFAVTIAITLATLDFFLRFVAFSSARTFFRLKVSGYEKIPNESPSLMLCNRPSSLIDTLLLTAIQRPPLRFLIESHLHHKKWLVKFCRLIRIILIPPHIEGKPNKAVLKESKKGLNKGYTVCVFVKTLDNDVKSMPQYLHTFQLFLQETPYALIPVSIDEKPLHPPSGKLFDLLKGMPWPVSISFGSDQNKHTPPIVY